MTPRRGAKTRSYHASSGVRSSDRWMTWNNLPMLRTVLQWARTVPGGADAGAYGGAPGASTGRRPHEGRADLVDRAHPDQPHRDGQLPVQHRQDGGHPGRPPGGEGERHGPADEHAAGPEGEGGEDVDPAAHPAVDEDLGPAVDR